MAQIVSKILLAAVLGLNSTATAFAYSNTGSIARDRLLPSGSALSDTEPTLAPMAFVQFCKAYEGQCKAGASPSSITLDARSWEDLRQINAKVNAAIEPDEAKGGFDWSLETRFGNCNDYAVQKRNALIKLGYPMAALSLAVVRTAFGEGHLVLTVRTDRGDLVLDNRRPAVLVWNRTGYVWLKRQSAEDPQYWVAVSTAPARRPARPADPMAPLQQPSRPEIGPERSAPGGVVVASAPAAISVGSMALGFGMAMDLALWQRITPIAASYTGIGHFGSTIANASVPLVSLALNSVDAVSSFEPVQ